LSGDLWSRDKDLLSLEHYEGVRFVTPETFLMILREGKEGPRS
jgi:hypothetical protein